MRNKINLNCLVAAGCCFFLSLCITPQLHAQSKDEVINGSYLVAFGRFANSGELNYWRQYVGTNTVKMMVEKHKQFIRNDQNEREQTVRRSYIDAFGWGPSADELKYWSSRNQTYGELMSNHINNWLNVYADKKEQVIKQSYQKVFGRNPNAGELKYWMGQPTISYVQLVATHTTWKQQNQQTSTFTSIKPNLNTNGISTAALSSQAVAAVVSAGGGNVVSAGGGNVVSAGGGNVVSAGGGN